jgi:hypothetical protein
VGKKKKTAQKKRGASKDVARSAAKASSSGGHGSGTRAGDVRSFSPYEVILIGYDTDDGPEHPLYDRKVKDPPTYVESFLEFGQIVPIVFVRDGDRILVEAGRDRVKSARVVHDLLRERARQAGIDPDASETLVEFRILGLPKKTDEATLVAIKHVENAGRRVYDILDQVDAVRDMVAHQVPRKRICAALKLTDAQLDERLALVKLAGPVRQAVEEGKLSPAAGVELVALPRAEQIAAVRELTEGGKRATVRQSKNKVRQVQGKEPVLTAAGRILQIRTAFQHAGEDPTVDQLRELWHVVRAIVEKPARAQRGESVSAARPSSREASPDVAAVEVS